MLVDILLKFANLLKISTKCYLCYWKFRAYICEYLGETEAGVLSCVNVYFVYCFMSVKNDVSFS